jgi:hypothetical protein
VYSGKSNESVQHQVRNRAVEEKMREIFSCDSVRVNYFTERAFIRQVLDVMCRTVVKRKAVISFFKNKFSDFV